LQSVPAQRESVVTEADLAPLPPPVQRYGNAEQVHRPRGSSVADDMKQQTLAMAADQNEVFQRHRRRTKREEFLETMNRIVPWAELCAVIEPHYPKAGNGRPPIGLERMLRMHFVQHWFNLADEACEEALLDMTVLRRFVGIDLGRERVPDATTLLGFRRLLEDKDLGKALFAKVGEVLQGRGLKVGTGTIVDATIIAAPSSTKNADKARDPEMHQTRKGQQWHFGMKLHIGVDSQSGLAHSAVVSAANVHDKHPLPQLLHGQERRMYGDSAYASQKELMQSKAPQAKDFTNQRTRKGGRVDEVQRGKNRNKSRVRARVEHVFGVLKRLWGFSKVRYRGLKKNATRAFVSLGLANIYLARGRLAA
jgi:IS5 family transposase